MKNLSQAAIRSWLDKNGVDSNGVGYIELAYSVMGEMPASGRIDAVSIAEPALSLSRAKLRVLASPFDVAAPQFSLGSYAANAEWVAKNRSLAGRVATALRQTAIWANGNQQQSGKILVDVLKMSEVAVSSMTRCNIRRHSRHPICNRASTSWRNTDSLPSAWTRTRSLRAFDARLGYSLIPPETSMR